MVLCGRIMNIMKTKPINFRCIPKNADFFVLGVIPEISANFVQKVRDLISDNIKHNRWNTTEENTQRTFDLLSLIEKTDSVSMFRLNGWAEILGVHRDFSNVWEFGSVDVPGDSTFHRRFSRFYDRMDYNYLLSWLTVMNNSFCCDVEFSPMADFDHKERRELFEKIKMNLPEDVSFLEWGCFQPAGSLEVPIHLSKTNSELRHLINNKDSMLKNLKSVMPLNWNPRD